MKMRKCAKGHGDMRKDAVMVGQGLSLDWGVMVQKLKNQERTQKLTSIDGLQSYLLVVDHYSNCFWSICSNSKSPPLGWLNHLLTKILPEHNNKYACMDLESELGQNEDVKALLIKHGYGIQPTRPDTSYQNSPAEQPHKTIATYHIKVETKLHIRLSPINAQIYLN
eukprot:15326671-Ditylum_brightwellii.AAC.1